MEAHHWGHVVGIFFRMSETTSNNMTPATPRRIQVQANVAIKLACPMLAAETARPRMLIVETVLKSRFFVVARNWRRV